MTANAEGNSHCCEILRVYNPPPIDPIDYLRSAGLMLGIDIDSALMGLDDESSVLSTFSGDLTSLDTSSLATESVAGLPPLEPAGATRRDLQTR